MEEDERDVPLILEDFVLSAKERKDLESFLKGLKTKMDRLTLLFAIVSDQDFGVACRRVLYENEETTQQIRKTTDTRKNKQKKTAKGLKPKDPNQHFYRTMFGPPSKDENDAKQELQYIRKAIDDYQGVAPIKLKKRIREHQTYLENMKLQYSVKAKTIDPQAKFRIVSMIVHQVFSLFVKKLD